MSSVSAWVVTYGSYLMRPVRANRIRDKQRLHHVVRLASKSGQIEKYVLVTDGLQLDLLLDVLDPE
jgi:cation transport regulator ChaC